MSANLLREDRLALHVGRLTLRVMILEEQLEDFRQQNEALEDEVHSLEAALEALGK